MKKGFSQLITGLLVMAVVGLILSKPVTYEHPVTIYTPVPLTYEISSPLTIREKTEFLWLKSNYASVAIKNTDSVSGTYTVEFVSSDENGIVDVRKVSHNILPGTIEVFETKIPSGVQIDVNIQPPKKQVPSTVIITEEIPLYRFIFLIKDLLK